jgi:hypothetical protein
MNTLPENTPEYPEKFEYAMRLAFGIERQVSLDKFNIPSTNNLAFTAGNLFKAILSGKLIGSQDINHPSWDNIENNRKDLKKDNTFPNASIDDLDEIYYSIMTAVKKHLVDNKTLASHQATDLDPDQYSIYAFVIDRFYKELYSKKSIELQSGYHDRTIGVLETSQV